MADNPYVNKVVYGDTTLMDISDTTATSSDVLNGKYFYTASGAKSQGSATIPVTDVTVNGTSVVSNGVAAIDLTGKSDTGHTHTTIDITNFPTLATVAISGDYSDLLNKPTVFTGTDGTAAGTNGLVPAPATTDATKYLMANGTWGFAMTGMVIAQYGTSTYAEVLDAYQKGWIIYTRASSNSNPATGSQNRMAFLAYVNNATTPTEFEFQYYRSLSSHTYNDQSDQVFIYKLNKNTGWSVTIRQATTKIIPSTGLTYTFVTGTSPTNTIKVNLNSETSLGTIGTTEGLYPIGVDSNGKLCVSVAGGGGSGSVTSVGLSNATDGGLTISGSPITSSGTISVGHSNVLSNAQTTQAVYPITIDKNGHISGYGSAVNMTSTTTATLTTAGWSSNTQTVSVSGVTASSVVIVSPTSTSYDDYCNTGVYCSAQGAGTLTFTCKTVPSSSLTVNVLYQ